MGLIGKMIIILNVMIMIGMVGSECVIKGLDMWKCVTWSEGWVAKGNILRPYSSKWTLDLCKRLLHWQVELVYVIYQLTFCHTHLEIHFDCIFDLFNEVFISVVINDLIAVNFVFGQHFIYFIRITLILFCWVVFCFQWLFHIRIIYNRIEW